MTDSHPLFLSVNLFFGNYYYISNFTYLCTPQKRVCLVYCSAATRRRLPQRLHKCSVCSGPPLGYNLNTFTYMPKVKTNSSAKKRFKVTATGKITHQKSFRRHILTKKSKKRKRAMRIDGQVHQSNMDFVKRLLRLK